MKNDEHDDLWRLLGEAKKPVVSPFFARNVLRAIREEEQAPQRAGFLRWLLRRRVPMAALALLVLGAVSFEFWQQNTRRQKISAMAEALSSSPDYAVISHLDELLAYEENSAWLDQTGY